MKRRLAMIVPLLLVLATPLTEAKISFEYDYPVVASRWGIDLGGFLVDLDTNAAVGFGQYIGTSINLEDALDLTTDQSVVRAEGFYRINRRNTFDFGYLAINRSASTVITIPIDFKDFRVSGAINSTFDMAQYNVIYKFSFINNGQINAGISTGLSVIDLSASIEGDGQLIDEQGMPIAAVSAEKQGATILAPIPSIGMFVQYAPAKWFILTLQGQFFDLAFGDFDFKFSDTRVVMDFYFTKHVGIGVGLNTVNMQYKQTGTDPLSFDYRYGGVLFHLGVAF